MTPRDQAISILKQARDLLAERLTERIIDARGELLEDAVGLGFASEIENLYDQVAMRLNHINTMLANLPPEDPGEPIQPTETPAPTRLLESKSRPEGVFQADTNHSAPAMELTNVLPYVEPMIGAHEATAIPSPVTFELFGRQIAAGDLDSAGRSLAVLFAVDEARGKQCAARFYEQLATTPETMFRIMQLRREMIAGRVNAALMLLWECFGLQGLESLGVLQTLMARLVGHNEAG